MDSGGVPGKGSLAKLLMKTEPPNGENYKKLYFLPVDPVPVWNPVMDAMAYKPPATFSPEVTKELDELLFSIEEEFPDEQSVDNLPVQTKPFEKSAGPPKSLVQEMYKPEDYKLNKGGDHLGTNGLTSAQYYAVKAEFDGFPALQETLAYGVSCKKEDFQGPWEPIVGEPTVAGEV